MEAGRAVASAGVPRPGNRSLAIDGSRIVGPGQYEMGSSAGCISQYIVRWRLAGIHPGKNSVHRLAEGYVWMPGIQGAVAAGELRGCPIADPFKIDSAHRLMID